MGAETVFEIKTAGVDVAAVMKDIEESVARKKSTGMYADPRVARAERFNLANLQNEDEFLPFYLDCLRDSVYVDINDFAISERRRFGAGILILVKRVLWSALKFYTFRLWSQQNQINGLLFAAIEGAEKRSRSRIEQLEARISALEKVSGSRS